MTAVIYWPTKVAWEAEPDGPGRPGRTWRLFVI